METIFIRVTSHRARKRLCGAVRGRTGREPECHWRAGGGYAYAIPAEVWEAMKAQRRIPGATKARDQSEWMRCWS